jgi:hypothetical protein
MTHDLAVNETTTVRGWTKQNTPGLRHRTGGRNPGA